MTRLICSHDRAAISEAAFVLTDDEGPIYFCGLRCLCLWAITWATKPNMPEVTGSMALLLRLPNGEEHTFSGMKRLARWASDLALA